MARQSARAAAVLTRPSAGPAGRDYRTNCKLCPAGVYTGQPAVWLTQPMGLSHVDCARRAGTATPPKRLTARTNR